MEITVFSLNVEHIPDYVWSRVGKINILKNCLGMVQFY